VALLDTDLTEEQLVNTILAEWGATPEITELPFGRSAGALAALARKAVRSLTGKNPAPRSWNPGDTIDEDVDEITMGNGITWTRAEPDPDDRRWLANLDEDELLNRFGTAHESATGVLADAVRYSAAVRLVCEEDHCEATNSTYGWACTRPAGHSARCPVDLEQCGTWHRDSLTGHSWADEDHHTAHDDLVAQSALRCKQAREILDHVRQTLLSVALRGQNRQQVTIELGGRAHTHARAIDGLLEDLTMIEQQVRA
jgi:hypothetical protein